MNKIVVAIDGYSSCGKSTIAKKLAAETGYIYVDTGAMYRAVALFAIRNGLMNETGINEKKLAEKLAEIKLEFVKNTDEKVEMYLNGENVESEIRTLEIANGASRISTLAFVRCELVRLQQLMGLSKGIVMDGRDIGTVVFPEAELKIFITASPEVRAMRRMKELEAKGEKVSYSEVLANVQERDCRDTSRAESPLKKADDAVLIDNTALTPAKQQEIVQKLFNKAANTDC